MRCHIVAFGIAVLSGLLALTPNAARASGTLTASISTPNHIDVTHAVASSPSGSTRWTRIGLAGADTTRVLWLVPARPGGAVDWAPDAWLDSLDQATRVQILPPAGEAPCTTGIFERTATRAGVWDRTSTATRAAPGGLTVLSTDAELRERAAAGGYALHQEIASRSASLFTAGWRLIAIELDGLGPRTSPTIRVSDDGAAALPFALSGGSSKIDHRVTVYAVTSGPSSTARSTTLDPKTLTWGARGSDYDAQRESSSKSTWVRESSSHDVFFRGVSGPVTSPLATIEPIAKTYFAAGRSPEAARACFETARSAEGNVGRVCAPGALLKLDGGACAPSTGTTDAAAFICGGADDLALALSSSVPAERFVTRYAGSIPAGSFGADESLQENAGPTQEPIILAGAFERCAPPAPKSNPITPPPPKPMPVPSPGSRGRATTTPAPDSPSYIDESDACDVAIWAASSEAEDSEGCSGDTSSSSSSLDDESYEESSDDDEDEYDYEDDSDDDDDDEEASLSSKSHPRTVLAKARAPRKRQSSPVSRFALLFGAIALPLRRRKKNVSL